MMKDKYELKGFNTPKLPKLKGHVKVTLHNCKNGKNEVIEGDNIVSNAVRDIFANNAAGAVDYSKLMPLINKWYSGVLLYEQAFPTTEVGGVQVIDPDDYYPRSDSDNHLFAHAGTLNIDSEHDDDLTRGNPVTPAFVYTEDSVKQVWEWGPSRGNVPDGRYIRSLALTHGDVGNAGLGSALYAFSQFNPLEQIDTHSSQFITQEALAQVYARFDDDHGLMFAIGEDGAWGDGHQAFETNKITVHVLKMPFSKAGLYQRQYATIAQKSSFTVQIPFNVYANPCFYFDQVNKRLWLFTNFTSGSAYSKTVIKYAVIDCVNKSVLTSGTITSDTENLAPMGYGDNTTYYGRGRSVFSGIVFDGTYFYFPTGNNTGAGDYRERLTGFQKINFNNQADQSTITLNSGEITNFNSPMYGGGLLIGTEWVANGNKIYLCQNAIGATPWSRYSTIFAQPNKPTSYAARIDTLALGTVDPYDWGYKWILANKMLNTTMFNLPSPVQKTSSQSMTVEYTLQEVDGGSES